MSMGPGSDFSASTTWRASSFEYVAHALEDALMSLVTVHRPLLTASLAPRILILRSGCCEVHASPTVTVADSCPTLKP
ncbi:unannotated protein [freshwater metagenome]|uniref:Unannotated protein n=1 Tax=freshwater metagenome TaxID=449393 RepID=A0A6J7RAM9_9ZZZZ